MFSGAQYVPNASALRLPRSFASSLRRLLQKIHVATEADQSLRVIADVKDAGDPLTIVRDTLIGSTVTPRLRTMLEGVPDFVVVLDTTGRTLYNSFAVRQLDPDDQVDLGRTAMRLDPTGAPTPYEVAGERLYLVARAVDGAAAAAE